MKKITKMEEERGKAPEGRLLVPASWWWGWRLATGGPAWWLAWLVSKGDGGRRRNQCKGGKRERNVMYIKE